MGVKAQILEMVDHVPVGELPVLLEVVRHFVPVGVDDIATLDDLAAHNAAMQEYEAGDVISHDSIDWD